MSNRDVVFDDRGLFNLVEPIGCTCGAALTHLMSCAITRCETGVYKGVQAQPTDTLRAWDIPHHFDRATEHQDGVFDALLQLMERGSWYPIRVTERGIDEQFNVPRAHVCWHYHIEQFTHHLIDLRRRHHRIVVTVAEVLKRQGQLWCPSHDLQQAFCQAEKCASLYDSMRAGILLDNLVHWGQRVAVEKKVEHWDRIWPDCYAICLDAASTAACRGLLLHQEVQEVLDGRRADGCISV
ncbi:MAG: hypothetical protein ACM3SS_05505 [Rhodospirillaceae bacterium]